MERDVMRGDSTINEQDVRCECGRLLARLERRGIVIKCHRCRSLFLIPTATVRLFRNKASG